jgi:hypothetical protein
MTRGQNRGWAAHSRSSQSVTGRIDSPDTLAGLHVLVVEDHDDTAYLGARP